MPHVPAEDTAPSRIEFVFVPKDGDEPVTFYVQERAGGAERLDVGMYDGQPMDRWRSAIKTMVKGWSGVWMDAEKKRPRPFTMDALSALARFEAYEGVIVGLVTFIYERTNLFVRDRNAEEVKKKPGDESATA